MTITLNGTTGITLPNGSASAPAATGSDTDTGIVYGTNTVSLATGGTTAVTVDSSQNVGIGTSSPSNKFVVSNAGAAGVEVNPTTGNIFTFNRNTSVYTDMVLTANNAIFQTGGTTERMRIDTSGNLLVGTTSAGSSTTRVSIVNTSGNANNPVMYLKANATSVATTMLGFYDGTDTFQGQIYCDVSGNTTVYATSSDYRMKNIEGPLTGAKDFIMALQPKQGTWKSSGAKFVGFLAHEFQEVSPSSVMGEKDAVDEEGKPIYQSMQASSPEVMANLVALIQEQQAIISDLKARIETLENK